MWISPRRTVVYGTLLAVACLLLPLSAAHGGLMHLKLARSEPAQGATVAAPTHLRLWFTLKPSMSVTGVTLLSSSDVAVKLGKPTFSGDVKQPVEVRVEESLAPGTYTVSWKTASSDMHPVTGDFAFTVK